MSWIKAADVQQDVKGSDHCPVFVDLHDEITTSDGSVIRLRDVLGARNSDSAPPRLSTKFWDEYSGKQTRLHNFFTKKATDSSKTGPSAPTLDEGSLPPAPPDDTSEVAIQSSSPPPSSADQASQTMLDPLIDDPAMTSVISQPSPITPSSSVATMTSTTSDCATDRLQKRKLVLETPLEKVKKQKGKKVHKSESSEATSQTKLSSFFVKPKAAVESETEPLAASSATKKGKEKEVPSLMDIIDVDDCPVAVTLVKDDIPDTEVEMHHCSPSRSFSSQGSAWSTSSGYGTQSKTNNGSDGNRNGNGKDAWSAILAPTPIPRCTVHNEPAKEYTVNKPGPNKGKRFFICSR